MNPPRKRLTVAVALAAGALCAHVASAAPFVVTIAQQGNDVTATGSGAFNLTGLTQQTTGVPCNTMPIGASPQSGAVLLGASAGCDIYNQATPFSGPAGFGTSSGGPATSASGDTVVMIPNFFAFTGSGPTWSTLMVPTGYTTGDLLSDTTTFANSTLAGLGFTPGTYTWTWGSNPDQSFTVFIDGTIQTPPPANPAYVIKLSELGNDVVATGSGAIDLTGLVSEGTASCAPTYAVAPSQATIVLGQADNAGCSEYDLMAQPFNGPTNFGNGSITVASSTSGGIAGFNPVEPGSGLIVPGGYVSDDLLSNSAVFSNATFASLGLTPGSYTWSWGNGANQRYTIEIGTFATGVPEPSALAMFGAGLLLLGSFVALRRRAA